MNSLYPGKMIKNRLSNFELLRICCMLMIVAGHIISQHKSLYQIQSSDEVVKLFCMSFFCVAVNTFILISGYFGISFKAERLFRLIIQTFFYSVFLFVLSLLLGWHTFNLKKDLFVLIPILSKQYWFVTCYVVLYIISPWLNKWVAMLDKHDYLSFLIMGFIIMYIWPTFSYLFNTGQFIGDAGYGIMNFAYLYLLGRYIKLHFMDTFTCIQYFGGYFLSAISLFICQYFLSWILGFEFSSWFSYNTLFTFIGSICLFMTFKNLHFNSGIVNFFAGPCLATYLIHKNPYIWNMFCESIGVSGIYGWGYIFMLIGLPIFIYLFCTFVEQIRCAIFGGFEKWFISRCFR